MSHTINFFEIKNKIEKYDSNQLAIFLKQTMENKLLRKSTYYKTIINILYSNKTIGLCWEKTALLVILTYELNYK